VRGPLLRVVEFSLVLPVGAVVALVWANSAHASYERFASALHFAVNDVGMAFFFALVTKEVVEATAARFTPGRGRPCRSSPRPAA
jgi:hypothetical protein